MTYVVIGIFVILFFATTWLRLRKGGPGPATYGPMPRGAKNRLNSIYRRAGWQQPYDDDSTGSA